MTRRYLALLILASAAVAAAVITPAWACGCGAYAPQRGGTATVPVETALVRVNADATEDVYLSLSLDSTVRSGALLFPVPDKAAALTQWLQGNGFTAKPALTAAAKPYTDRRWAFVAVRLRPGAGSATKLAGTLDPLHIHFASKEVVYPMRLSAMGSEPEQVRVYTLAPHRLDLSSADPGMTVSWADTLGELGGYPDLAGVAVAGSRYLTRFDGVLNPASITDDFHFSRAGSDAAHRPQVFEGGSTGGSGDHTLRDVLLGLLAVAILLALAGSIAFRRRAR